MNEITRNFLNSMLIENPVYMGLFGALAALVLPRTARTSYAPALRFGIALFFSGFFAGAMASLVPTWTHPFMYIAISICAISVLMKSGDLTGTFCGLPRSLIAAAPLFGIQLLLSSHSELSIISASAAGSAIGFSAAYIIMAAIRENVMIAESKKIFKTNPVMIFSMAIFAIVMSGFLLW